MDELRKKAESLIDEIKLDDVDLKKRDKISLIYELLVHQRELEIQNEEIRRANLELEELKNRYFDLYNSSPVGYIELNENGIIKNFNQTFLAMLGLKQTFLEGKSFFDFVDSRDYKYFLSVYRDFFKYPEGKTIEIRLNTHKKNKYMAINGKKDLKGDNLLVTITDISEIKESHQKITQYLNILNIAPISIIITDSNNRIIYLNDFYSKITGYSKEELLGKNPGFLKSGETPKETYTSLWRTLKEKRVWEGIFINKKKNGEKFIEEAKILPVVDEHGFVSNYIAVKSDVTEKKALEEKERRLRQIQSLVTISGGIAHHLNNINTPILIIAQELLRKATTEEDKYMANVIINSINRATNIINSILKFSRNIIMFKRETDLEQVLRITVKKFKDLETTGHNIHLNIIDKNIKVSIDFEMLSQAIFNIIQNAIESMPSGGDVNITLKKELIKKDAFEGWYAVISITDYGLGIPEHIKDRIFEPFFTTKMMRNATGLGLSESVGIVENHGGFIDYESKVNEGSTFNIYIPMKKEVNQDGR
jgi:PAS domain S-box-containing protein